MIHYISLRVSAQATEDPKKVRSAIGLFLPPAEDESKLKGSDIISEYVTSGYYGNKIILMEAELHKKKHTQYVIDLIRQRLGKQEMLQLVKQVHLRVDDDCNLYIRFNKQQAFQGKLVMTNTSDVVLLRIKLKAYPAKYERAIEVARIIFDTEDRSWV